MIKVLGHRGLRQDKGIDENSLAAIETAFKTADGAEIDVSVSADGTPFVIHDISKRPIVRFVATSFYVLKDKLDKKSAKLVGNKRLDQLKDRDIEKLRLKKGSSIAKLSDVFALAAKYPGKTINIELKGQDSLAPTLREIDKAVAAGQITKSQIVISSFDHIAIAEAKAKAPDIKRGLIFADRTPGKSAIYPWSKDKTRRYKTFNAITLQGKTAQDAQPDFLVMTAARVTRKKIELMQQFYPQAKLAVWSSREKPPSSSGPVSRLLNDPDIRPLLETVITDYPELMKKKFKSQMER